MKEFNQVKNKHCISVCGLFSTYDCSNTYACMQAYIYTGIINSLHLELTVLLFDICLLSKSTCKLCAFVLPAA